MDPPAGFDPSVTIPLGVDDVLGQHWHRFKSSGDQRAFENLLLHYAPLVKDVAGRVTTSLPEGVEQGDLVSYGMFGLIEALKKVEPARGNKFEPYAIPRIEGAIMDELQ